MTAMQPDLGEHGGIHAVANDWTVMSHAVLNLVYDTQSGPRGGNKTFVFGMLMSSARREFADGSKVNLRAMLSPDPLMGKNGYPLLLAAGQTADGVSPLVDRQYPHDVVMELSASYSRQLSDKDSIYADVSAPEQLEPDEDERKWSASVIHTRRLAAEGWWSSTAAWGRKINDHGESKDGGLLETAVHPNDRWTVVGRAERIETDELVPGLNGGHGPLFTVSKASLGLVRDWRIAPRVRLGLGGLYAFNQVPGPLEPLYGGNPDGTMVFARLKIE